MWKILEWEKTMMPWAEIHYILDLLQLELQCQSRWSSCVLGMEAPLSKGGGIFTHFLTLMVYMKGVCQLALVIHALT